MAEEKKDIKEEVLEEQSETAAEEPELKSDETAEKQADKPTPDEPGNSDEKACEEPEKAEEKKSEDEDLKTQFLRLSADFQNYRRRVESEKADIYAYANEKIVLQVLDVIDNFDRAMSAAAEGDKFAEGMQLILKQLLDVLAKNNVAEIDALGKDFDPNFHNAVMTEPAAEGEGSGKVTKVLQKGYTLNSKVIRPAMVAVSQ